MALSDAYEVRVFGRLLSVNWNIVFHALRSGAGYDSADVGNAFSNTCWGTLNLISTVDTLFDGIAVKNLGDPLDFTELSLAATPGADATDTFSPFAAYTIKFIRKRTDMHHGYKRIPGVSSADVSDGLVSAGKMTQLTNFANDVLGIWDLAADPGVSVARYIVVKRVLDGGIYRLPKTDGEFVHYVPDTSDPADHVSTQNSRKIRES